MIDSITIFSKTGLVGYHYNLMEESKKKKGHHKYECENEDDTENVVGRKMDEGTAKQLNRLIFSILTTSDEQKQPQTNKYRTVLKRGDDSSNKCSSIVAEWQEQADWVAIVLYSEVVLRRQDAKWIRPLLKSVLYEYSLLRNNKSSEIKPCDFQLFDQTYSALQSRYEGKSQHENSIDDMEKKDSQPVATKSSKVTSKSSKPKKGKEARVWHDGKGKLSKEMMASLDRSEQSDTVDGKSSDDSNALREARAAYLPAPDEIPLWEQDESFSLDDDIGDDNDIDDSGNKNGWGFSLKGLFDQMSGNKVLIAQDLETPLQDMEKLLTSKNVARDISEEICNQVKLSLIGKRLASFRRVKTAVRQALEQAIYKILHPPNQKNTDLLSAVTMKRESNGSFLFRNKAQSRTKPFVIVMVGINGVGKSTSLAKIAYYLKSNGCNPLLAACDTFRSGAVEQLNVHAKCLDIPLYHQGYAKDPSAVASTAIDHATNEGHDVVLVDTAGRMQNNVPLMKALSKLVVENQPDLVLFVCEALVGNDGIDQLVMFNKALRSGGHVRQIDGVLLTKFDTVSDKVGAALTMTHVTGAPIVFVGTGQKYNHLKKLSVPSVIQSLFS